jgi:hypothetical protein
MALSSVTRTLVVVTVVGMLLVGGGFAYLVWDFMRPVADSEEHELSYTLVVEPTADLTNVSLQVPLPTGDENLTGAIVAEARETFPAATAIGLVNTSDGTMLSIEADSLPARWENRPPPRTPPADGTATEAGTPASPTETATPRPVLSGYVVEVTLPVVDRVDTRNPVGNESTLHPRLDATETDCFNERSAATCTEFATSVRLDYDTDSDTTLYLTTRVEGRNTWFAGGWTGNSYSQYLSTELTGPQSGWQRISVYEETGGGNYHWPAGNAIAADLARFVPTA